MFSVNHILDDPNVTFAAFVGVLLGGAFLGAAYAATGRLDELGVLILRGSPPEDFGKNDRRRNWKWGKAVKFANISADWMAMRGVREELYHGG